MSRTQTIAISAFVLFVLLATAFDSCNNQVAHMQDYTKEIESYLRPLETEVEAIFENKEVLHSEIFYEQEQTTEVRDSVLKKLEVLSGKNFGIYFYYEYLESPFESNPDTRAAALIPVKNEFRLESSYLENWFTASSYIPWQVGISEKISNYVVTSNSGKPLFFLDSSEPFKDAPQQKLILLFYILAALSMAIFINSLSRQIVQQYQPWWGAAFLIGSVLFLRLLSFKLDFSDKFDNLAIFARAFQTPVLSYHLGDLLIDILLLLWLMVFFHREFKVKAMINISTPWQFLLTTLNYFSILLGILMITSVFKSLVLDSGITFDFDNVFQLSIYSVLAIFGVILLLFALFLFSHRMMLTIQNTGLEHKYRLASQFAALLLAFPVIYLTDLDLPFQRLALGSVLYILLFDLYIEFKNPSITWLGIWLLFFSSFSAVLLFKYNEDKDLYRRMDYSKALSVMQDTSAVRELSQFQKAINNDPKILKMLFDKTLSSTEMKVGLTKRINNIYSDYKYLFNIYSYDFLVDGLSSKKDTSAENSIFENYSKSIVTDSTNVKYWTEPEKSYSYLISRDYSNPEDSTQNARIYLEAHKKLRKASRVYTELILTQDFKGLKNLELYDYAIYKNNLKVEASSGLYENSPEKYLSLLDPKDEYSEIVKDGRSEFIHQTDDGIVVVIGRPLRDLLKPISLFSYLFVLLGLTVVILATINSFTRLLPEVLKLTFWRKPSLKNKIQLSVIMTIIGSFVMIGWVTVVYFRQTSDEYHENRLKRKLGAVLLDAEHEIQLELEARKGQEVDLEKLVNAVSPIHRMDINVYDLQGDLITSTEMDIFNKGIIAPKMGGVAYHALVRQGKSENIQSERIGDLSYKAAYVPLRKPNGKVTGYIGLPYYAKQRNLKDDVYEFMGTLLNVYVF